MTNLAHETTGETTGEITPKELAKREKISVRAIGIPYAKLRAQGHPLFASQFDQNAPLSLDQIVILRPGKMTAKKTAPKITESAATFAAPVAMTPEQGRPNEVAPQGKEDGKSIKWGEVTALGIAFVLPTLASAFNTYNVSHQLSKNEWVALFVMGMVMLTPVLFIAARMDWTGVVVAFGVVLFEGFCNASATYLALMGQMEYILDDKRGQCSDFLQSVVNLTSSDHRPTAVLLGAILSVIIAATQLTAFWGIRKRI